MDENKINDLFREILLNKTDCPHPSSYATSSSGESSIQNEHVITYNDVLEKLQILLTQLISIDTDIVQILKL